MDTRSTPQHAGLGKGMMWLASGALSIYLICVPFYVFPSGIPQPSDFVLCIAFAAITLHILYTNRLAFERVYQTFLILIAVLVIYIWTVDLVWMALLANPTMMAFPVFYLFNFLAFEILLLTFQSVHNADTTRLIARSCIVAVLLQAVLSPLVTTTFSPTGVRQVLFFNNPNQLANYAVLTGSIVALARDRALVSFTAYALALLSVTWLVALSLSKAGLVAHSFFTLSRLAKVV